MEEGDTLVNIARMYNSSAAALAELNRGVLAAGPDLLQIGSTILVPTDGLPHERRVRSTPESSRQAAAMPVGRPPERRPARATPSARATRETPPNATAPGSPGGPALAGRGAGAGRQSQGNLYCY